MKEKGQGALEYLLLIGGAVLIAAIALAIISGLGTAGKGTVEKGKWAAQCAALGQNFCENTAYDLGTSDEGYCGTQQANIIDCKWNTTNKTCEPNFNCQ